VKVTWILPDGSKIDAEVADGTTLMQAAVDNGVQGIPGDCGGNMACATCHVVVDMGWYDKTGAPGDHEDIMLDTTLAPREATSRLSCQIEASAALEGLILRVPEG